MSEELQVKQLKILQRILERCCDDLYFRTDHQGFTGFANQVLQDTVDSIEEQINLCKEKSDDK